MEEEQYAKSNSLIPKSRKVNKRDDEFGPRNTNSSSEVPSKQDYQNKKSFIAHSLI